MKKAILLLTILIVAISAQAQLNYVYKTRLNDVFDSVCNLYNIKGATAAIIVPNEGSWERAWGESHQGAPITTDMYMGIGSNTKTYTAVALLKLQEQGKLSLDDTIGKWISHQHVPGNITIRQLLNHTSGLYSFTNNNDINNYILPDYTKVWPIDSVMNLVKAPNDPPGTKWEYCNTNYTIAGIIIRAITGKSVHQSLRDIVLTPNNLNESFFFPQETPTGTIPHAWSNVLASGSAMEDMIAVHNYSHNAFLSLASSAGAYVTTAKDNALFWDRLMNGNMLSSQSKTELLTLTSIGFGQGYGLGLFNLPNFNGRTIVSHGGTGFGFINENLHDKTSGVSITVLTNQDSISNSILLDKVIRALHKVTIRYTDVETVAGNSPAIMVYPNPAKDVVYIKLQQANTSMSLFNMAGQQVHQQVLKQGDNMIKLPQLPSGSYLLNVKDKQQQIHTQTLQVVN